MAFIECVGGGGASFDLLNPDVTRVYYNSASSGASLTIPVTQMPKYIVLACWTATTSTNNTGMVGIIDVSNDTAKRIGYWSGAAQSLDSWSNYTSYFTTISSSTVKYSTTVWSSSYATRHIILIYY